MTLMMMAMMISIWMAIMTMIDMTEGKYSGSICIFL